MFSSKINIFKLCRDFIIANCETSSLGESVNNSKAFTSFLIKDENNNFIITDKEFSIKCLLEENFMKKFLGANETINYENLNSKINFYEIQNFL